MNAVNPTDADPVRAEYRRIASEYDERWSFYVEATTRETLARIELGDGERLLDVGCGTGRLLARIHDRYPKNRLTGVDLCDAMLEVARDRLPDEVALKEASAESLPFDDESFDMVVSSNVFHYFRQPDVMLGEARRVLRPGGRLVITDWCRDYLACHVYDIYLRWTDPAHFRTYHSRACRDLLQAAKFLSVSVERYRISWLWGLMTAKAMKNHPG